jgi:hypothetical protein
VAQGPSLAAGPRAASVLILPGQAFAVARQVAAKRSAPASGQQLHRLKSPTVRSRAVPAAPLGSMVVMAARAAAVSRHSTVRQALPGRCCRDRRIRSAPGHRRRPRRAGESPCGLGEWARFAGGAWICVIASAAWRYLNPSDLIVATGRPYSSSWSSDSRETVNSRRASTSNICAATKHPFNDASLAGVSLAFFIGVTIVSSSTLPENKDPSAAVNLHLCCRPGIFLNGLISYSRTKIVTSRIGSAIPALALVCYR